MGKIIVTLDLMLARRKMKLKELAEKTGVAPVNLSLLKNGHARAVRFTTLAAICAALDCKPADLLDFDPTALAAEDDSEGET